MEAGHAVRGLNPAEVHVKAVTSQDAVTILEAQALEILPEDAEAAEVHLAAVRKAALPAATGRAGIHLEVDPGVAFF